jgi:hypothetical protein
MSPPINFQQRFAAYAQQVSVGCGKIGCENVVGGCVTATGGHCLSKDDPKWMHTVTESLASSQFRKDAPLCVTIGEQPLLVSNSNQVITPPQSTVVMIQNHHPATIVQTTDAPPPPVSSFDNIVIQQPPCKSQSSQNNNHCNCCSNCTLDDFFANLCLKVDSFCKSCTFSHCCDIVCRCKCCKCKCECCSCFCDTCSQICRDISCSCIGSICDCLGECPCCDDDD